MTNTIEITKSLLKKLTILLRKKGEQFFIPIHDHFEYTATPPKGGVWSHFHAQTNTSPLTYSEIQKHVRAKIWQKAFKEPQINTDKRRFRVRSNQRSFASICGFSSFNTTRKVLRHTLRKKSIETGAFKYAT